MKARLFIWIGILFFTVTASAQDKSYDTFLDQADYLFSTYVNAGLVDYRSLKEEPRWSSFIQDIDMMSVDKLDEDQTLSFYINAYNALIINKVLGHYPIASVNEVPNYFSEKNIKIAGKQMSLDGLEKMILNRFDDPRLHFILVCGAVSCPKLKDEAYRPETIQEEIEQVTKNAFRDPRIFDKLGTKVYVSKIFSWYEKDFGVLENYINKYLDKPVTTDGFEYLVYDWGLNDQNASLGLTGNNNNRYVSSATIAKGGWELKIFNNFYTQQDSARSNRNTFYTTSISVLYGLSTKWNVGLSTRYRRVNFETGPSSFLHVFNGAETGQLRTGITAIGPQFRWAPSQKLKGFSIQSAFLFPTADDLAGGGGKPYIDWNGASWFTQFFYDKSLGENFSLFTELGFTLEDTKYSTRDVEDINRVTIPATVILSYFPIKNLTIYGLGNYASFQHGQEGGFWQFGSGLKYQFTQEFELELLSTYFGSTDLSNSSGTAATYNLGLRFNL